MRRYMILILAGLLSLVAPALAATPEPSAAPTVTGQDLADALGRWDGYDFQDAGDAWPGALRSGPSDGADPSDPYGADGTILILPPLDSTAHPVVTVRLSAVAGAAIWDHYQRIFDELGLTETEQQAAYGALGQVLAQAYAQADDGEHTHAAAVDAGAYHVLWQSRTSGFESATDPAQPAPTFLMPEGGVTLEIVPVDEASVVVPMPEPTATPTPAPTPRRTPRPTTRPTPTSTAGAAQVAPPPTDFVCDGVSTAITDPLSKGWNIKRIDWGNKGKYDRLTITLDQSGKGGDGTQAIVNVMPVNEVASTLKVTAPSAGDQAIAIGLYQDVKLTWSLDRALTTPAMKWITMEKDNNGFPWVVLGTKDGACYSIQVPAWTASNPKSKTPIQVVVDIKH
jgi:hypothetical protein